ncbi:MAG: 23S rRNA (pseudouridine(1915)-N(3))-methyltransferase RlmH [Bacteroidales bacterium]|jgi:23S rRNA (pseudouridine1915-N3)-methyltransferase|nr:23S rRNA (pseudouridine(1915)-N(3))-methyltransferase RlmH [Bacteroidales bacterium]
MKITFLWIGKTTESWLQEGIDVYVKRLKHYISLSIEIIPAPKNLPKQDMEKQKEIEGDAILDRIMPSDEVYLLDERGMSYSSEGLTMFLQEKMSASVKRLVLVVGGPFGFSGRVYQRANGQVSFSQLTFSHQMIRLLVCEQVYRAFTILRGEPYHHR